MSFLENRGKPAPPRNRPNSNMTAVASEPEKQCIHRTWNPIGKLRCNCSHQPVVYGCDLPWVSSGYCMPSGFEKLPADGPVVLPTGDKIVPKDARMRTFMPWVLKDDETPTDWQVIACARCPKRIDPPPQIVKLKQLGIQGNYDPETGYADTVHVVPLSEHWQQHAQDQVNSVPDNLRACWTSVSNIQELESIQSATNCRLIIINAILGAPDKMKAFAIAFPQVKLLGVFHGSQNMVVLQDWSRTQQAYLKLSRELPNVWYGSPESTAPWRDLGYDHFVTWPNTMPFVTASSPLWSHEPPAILIAGRKAIEKAHPANLLAAGLIGKRRPIKLLAVHNGGFPYKALEEAAGIQVEAIPWTSQVKFRQWIRESVSLTLQATLTDSFNYLALDSLSQGRPVVGSQTVRYLPKKWQADPNDPYDIARIAMEILDDYDTASAEALKLACEVRDRQKAEYCRLLERILA